MLPAVSSHPTARLVADASLSTTQLGVWLLGAAFVMQLIPNILAMVRFLRRDKEQNEVSFAAEYAAKSDVETLSERLERVELGIENVKSEIKGDCRELDRRSEDRITKVHDRINQVLEAVFELRGKVGP